MPVERWSRACRSAISSATTNGSTESFRAPLGRLPLSQRPDHPPGRSTSTRCACCRSPSAAS
ncbi:MAG: hypothetical protein MZU95_03375 [Desulfomicrobium escambiense]|nr:hypothetical protein [Desulfomicrobium escambiense]